MIMKSCSGNLIQVFSHRTQAESLLMLMWFWVDKHISFSCIFCSVSHAWFLFFHLISFSRKWHKTVYMCNYFAKSLLFFNSVFFWLTITHTVSLQGVCGNFLFFVKKAPFLGLLFFPPSWFTYVPPACNFCQQVFVTVTFFHANGNWPSVCSLKHVWIWDRKKRKREHKYYNRWYNYL